MLELVIRRRVTFCSYAVVTAIVCDSINMQGPTMICIRTTGDHEDADVVQVSPAGPDDLRRQQITQNTQLRLTCRNDAQQNLPTVLVMLVSVATADLRC